MALPTNPISIFDHLLTESVKNGNSSDFLERWLTGFQGEWDVLVEKIVELPYMFDPFRLPEIVGSDGKTTIDYALWLVGITDELEYLTADLTTAQKRLLLASAAALWKKKGLPEGWRRWLRLLTGVSSLYLDYFYWRCIVDEDFLGDGGVLLDPYEPDFPAGAVYGAYESDLCVEDPGADLRTTIASLVEATRPASERIRIRWLEALELFDRQAALARWDRTGGSITIDTDAETMTMAVDGTIPTAIFNATASTFAWYTVRIGYTPADDTTDFSFLLNWQDDLNYIRVNLNIITQAVWVYERSGGAENPIGTGNITPEIVAGVEYHIEITLSQDVSTDVTVVVHIDGEPMLTTSMTTTVQSGAPGLKIFQGSATFRRFMAYRLPVDYTWVAPFGAFDEEA